MARHSRARRRLPVFLLALLWAVPAFPAGFGIFEQGAKAKQKKEAELGRMLQKK